MRSFGLVEEKVAEADFFLCQLSSTGCDLLAVRCYFSAFAASARSITFVLQSALKDIEGFESWYATKQEALRSCSIARFFLKARNLSQKLGVNPVSFLVSERHDLHGLKARWYFAPGPNIGGLSQDKRVVELGRTLLIKLGFPRVAAMTPADVIKHCSGCHEFPDPPDTDVVAACTEYMTLLVSIIFECCKEFGTHVDPQQYYTEQHFSSMGKTIEDAEEHLFGLRGWTAAAGVPLEYRWQMIRDSQPRCQIEHLFEQYLGKRIPALERLPKLPPPSGEGWYEIQGQGRVFIPKSLRKTGDPVKDLDLFAKSFRNESEDDSD